MTLTPPGPFTNVAALIERAVVRGSLWLIGMGMLSRILSVVGTLLLTHLIAPAVYGEVADAVVVTFTINALANVGIGVYVIAHPDGNPEDMFHAALVHIGLAALFLVPLYFAGPRLGLML